VIVTFGAAFHRYIHETEFHNRVKGVVDELRDTDPSAAPETRFRWTAGVVMALHMSDIESDEDSETGRSA
jgi:hypothetical protein